MLNKQQAFQHVVVLQEIANTVIQLMNALTLSRLCHVTFSLRNKILTNTLSYNCPCMSLERKHGVVGKPFHNICGVSEYFKYNYINEKYNKFQIL